MQQTMMMLEMRRQGMLICFISRAMSPRLNMSLSGWLSWWGDGDGGGTMSEDGVEVECVKVVCRCVVISTSSSRSSLIVLFMIELLKNCAFISKHYIIGVSNKTRWKFESCEIRTWKSFLKATWDLTYFESIECEISHIKSI